MWTLDAESGRAPHKVLIKCILQLNPAERCSELALGGNDLRSQGSLGVSVAPIVQWVGSWWTLCCFSLQFVLLQHRRPGIILHWNRGLSKLCQVSLARCKMQDEPTNQLEAIETQRHNFSFSFFLILLICHSQSLSS